PDLLIIDDRILDLALRIQHGRLQHLSSRKADVEHRHVAEITDVPDLALNGVDSGIGRRGAIDAQLFRADGEAGVTTGGRGIAARDADIETVPAGKLDLAVAAGLYLAFENVHVADEVGDEARIR